MARKRKQKPPPDEKRCKATKQSGGRCTRARKKDSDFCHLHVPGNATKVAQKGGKATARNWARLKGIAKKWPIGQSWANQITFGEAMVGECLERGDKPGRFEAMAWNKQLIKAMEARDKLKDGGARIALILHTDGQFTKWQQPPGERPEPTPFDGEELGFVPPKGET